MFELSIGIPQVVMLVICLINVVMSAIHHGEEQGPYNVWTTLLGIAIKVGRFLLMAGKERTFSGMFLCGDNRNNKCQSCPAYGDDCAPVMAQDIVRRAKALAGVADGE